MDRIPPESCQTMSDVRASIDALDQELVALLAQRAGYIDRAAELKPGEGIKARVPWRVEEVVSNARSTAKDRGLAPDFVETLWRQIVEWSIAREAKVID